MSFPNFNVFPEPELVFTPLTEEQLAILEAQVESEQPVATVQSQFNYSWGLIKSNDDMDIKHGIDILIYIYKTVPSRRIESLYYLALACYKIKEYQEATRYLKKLLQHAPTNKQGIQLEKMIENELAKDSVIGFAIISGVVAVGVGIASVFLRRKR